MKNNIVKLFIVLSIASIIVFGATLIYVNSQIKPEKIKKIIINTIESNLVDSTASIASLDYDLGQKIIFTLESLSIKNKDKELITLDKVKVYIPIVSILTSGGVVDINLSDSKLNIERINGELNLKKIIPTQKGEKSEPLKLEIPKFLEKSRINLKVMNTHMKFLNENELSDFHINKIIMKNINLKKTTAFEFQTDLNMLLREKKLQTSITLIGEIPIKNILESKAAKIDLMLKSDQLVFGEYELKASRHRGVVTYTNPNKVSVNLRSELDGLLNGDIEAAFTGQKVSVKKVEYTLNVENILKTLKLENHFKDNAIDLSNLNVVVKGGINYNLEDATLIPNLLVSTSDRFKLSVKKVDFAPMFSLNLINDDMKFNFQSAIDQKGSVTLDLKTKLNLKDIQNFNPVELNINAQDINVNIPKVSLVEIANQPKNDDLNEEAEVRDLDPQTLDQVPELKVAIKIEKSSINKIPFTFESLTNFSNRKVVTKNFLFNFPEAGKINSNNIELDLSQNKKIKGQGEILLDLNLLYFETLLPVEVQKVKGQMNGSIGVLFDLEKELNYQAKGKLNIKDGSIRDFYIYDFIKPVINKYSFLKKEAKKNKEVSTSFSLLSSQFKMSKEEIDLNKFNCYGVKDEFKIDGKGKLKLKETENSSLYVNMSLKTIESDLKRNFGKSKIPLKLVGKGFFVTPDISYTTKTLGKSFVKNTGAKAKNEVNKRIKVEKKKINKQINKEKKKVEDKLKKEAEKMLKGIKL